MKKEITKRLEERASCIDEARKILDKAEKESRNLTGEEQEKYDRCYTKAEELNQRVKNMRNQMEAEATLAEASSAAAKPETREGEERETPEGKANASKMAAFRNWLVNGRAALKPEETRLLTADDLTEGGALVPPQEFVAMLIKFVDDILYLRQWGTVITLTTAASLGMPEMTNDISDADFTAEISTGTEDSDLKFALREQKPHPLAKRIKVSNKLLRLGALSPETIVMQRLAYKFGVTEEKAFLTGTGAAQPLGIFTTSNSGIDSSRDISNGNTSTSITFDGLISAKYALKPAHRMKARWLFNRAGVEQIAKLKDSEGRFLWEPSRQIETPDRILSHEVRESEFVPAVFTANKLVGVFANFEWYHIVEALDMTVQRLVELYAEENKTGFIGRMEIDGAPVLAEAFARVKLGS